MGGIEKEQAALRGPGRTSRGMASSDQPPEGWDLLCLTCAPGRSGFSEPVCLLLPPSQQLRLQPVLWIEGVGWEKGDLGNGWQRSKWGKVGRGHCLFTIPLPHSSSSPQPCPSFSVTLPCLLSFLMVEAAASSSPHGPSSLASQLPTAVHPHRAPELTCPSSAQHSSMASRHPTDRA